MIAYLNGTILFNSGTTIIVSTAQGVGYELNLASSKNVGQKIEVYTYQVIRETAQDLYGFESFQDRQAFEKLISVNGVGPKSAYSLVSTLGCGDLYQAILLEQVDLLKQAPGIGKKAAGQIILSLKDKIEQASLTMAQTSSFTPNASNDLFSESLSALTALGYREAEILPIIKRALEGDPNQDSAAIVKVVLKEL